MKIIEQLFRFIAPDECYACGKEGSLICKMCEPAAYVRPPARCYRCYRQSDTAATCPACRRHSMLKNVFVCTLYTKEAREVVHRLKFGFTKSAAEHIARHMAEVLQPLPPDLIITHVPTASSHVRQRGFDQSALIARELAYLTGVPHIHTLARIGQQRQVGANRALRLTQMKDAFRTVSKECEGAHVLLVDDVLTTGSTIESAALALKSQGAKSVSAVVFAQAR